MRMVLVMLLVCTTSLAVGDVVYLKNGRTVEGKVTDLGNEVKVKLRWGAKRIPKSEILRIETKKPPQQQFRERLKTITPDDIDALMELARWCKKHALSREAKTCFKKIIEANPDDSIARHELGYRQVGNTWRLKCKRCSGKGTIQKTCVECGGRGKVSCPSCGGKGTSNKPCPACKGGLITCPACRRKPVLKENKGWRMLCATCKGVGTIDCKLCKRGLLLCPDCTQGRVKCPKCEGKGQTEQTCQVCGGTGLR